MFTGVTRIVAIGQMQANLKENIVDSLVFI